MVRPRKDIFGAQPTVRFAECSKSRRRGRPRRLIMGGFRLVAASILIAIAAEHVVVTITRSSLMIDGYCVFSASVLDAVVAELAIVVVVVVTSGNGCNGCNDQ